MQFNKKQQEDILNRFYSNEDGFADLWLDYFDIISTDMISKEKAYVNILKEVQEILQDSTKPKSQS